MAETRKTRPVSWIKAALKDFEAFPKAAQLADAIWVIHAFQKKSKQGIRTPQHEIDLVKDRLKRLKEALS
jgi:phage-related protein